MKEIAHGEIRPVEQISDEHIDQYLMNVLHNVWFGY